MQVELGGVAVKEDAEMKIYECHAQDSRYNERTVSPTLGRKMGTGSGNIPLVENDYVVRRLTPLECERLQGLPDNYTAYGSDTARYKAIGNGMAQPCADFVMNCVVKALEEINERL